MTDSTLTQGTWRRIGTADRRTLASSIAAVGIVLLLLAGAFMVIYNERSYRESKAEQVEVQARILASTVAAALLFDDRKAAREYVNALAGDAEVGSAAVYDASGALFASYSRTPDRPPPARAVEPRDPTYEGDWLTVITPVTEDSRILGTVYMHTIVAPIFRRLAQYTVIGILVAMAALVFVLLAIAQRRLGEATARLERQSSELAQTNDDLRAQIEYRERAETALRQAQKMEVIGQLTGGIAHDFNNLLQVIMGNLEALQRRTPDAPDEVRRMMLSARRGAERAATLTQRLLAFARRQPLNPRPVDVNRLVGGMSELLHRTLGESITVETVLASGIWRIAVDANQLENALLNLAVNGRDAMPAGGRLTIETANSFLDEAYASVHEAKPGQYVVLAVSDTGSGMDKEVLQKAFEPFFTTKDVGKGSGLGLSQVYGFVRQSGGHLKIYSEVGEGTTVKLYLPRLAGEQESHEAVAERADVSNVASGRTILVVEDEEDVRAHAVSMLRELGYTVLEAADGPSALRVLERDAAIDLLFTDVGLPGGMNGRQLADLARTRRGNIRVLFTTGYARNAIVHQGRLDADVELITKPFTYAELADKVYRLIDVARATALPDAGGESPAGAAVTRPSAAS